MFKGFWFKSFLHVDFMIPSFGFWKSGCFLFTKTFKNSWYSLGTISSTMRSCFFRLFLIAMSIARLIFALIQTGSNFPLTSIKEMVDSSSSSRVFWVLLRYSSSSRTSIKVAGVLLSFHHVKVPVSQLISGFCSSNHGNPRMIFWCPKPVTKSFIAVVLFPICRLKSTYRAIVPVLFSVPSTL